MSRGLENQLFQLRFTAKTLVRESKRCEKQCIANKKKCKTAMVKGNTDGARIYAESAIREKNQALNFLRLSSRIDAVAQRVNTAVKMGSLNNSMSKVVTSMSQVLKNMNPEKIQGVMDKFEKQFEDLDVASAVTEDSISQSTSQAMPESQVDSLMQQVADEHGLEFNTDLDAAPVGKESAEEKQVDADELDLEARLRKLQGM